MKFSKLSCNLSCIALLGALIQAPLTISDAYAKEVKLDSTACIVNSGIILESELNAEEKRIKEIAQKRGFKIDDVAARTQAFRRSYHKKYHSPASLSARL